MGIVESTYAELKQQELKNNPYSCLHMADIDINPHQVEAFTFALSSLELGGAILADEVGLGKTIEAGLVIKYLLCSGKNKILLIMPSNLRKQWQVELEEKFDIDSLIVDSSNWEDYLAKVKSKQAVIIVSYHFASKRKTEFGKIAWDFCVFDDTIYRTYVVQQENEFQNALMSRMEKNSLYSVEYVPSRGRNEGKQTTLFYHNGELCAWLKDTAFLEGKDVVKTTKLSNVWKNDDIPKADLGNEGGVAFPRSKKPEKLIERILLMATNEGDLVLDSFLGSGTTAAVAHKMRRRYIGIELGDHCYTHCKKRLDRVIDGKDRGGVTNTYDWQGGGGYKFYELAEPLLVKNKVLPVYQINPSYTWDMVCEAICKIEGFTYEPYGEFQGHSSENRFIHITEEFVNTKYAMSIMKNLGDKQSLLIYCKKNQSDMILPENVEVKKIPKDLLDKCNFESEVQE